MDQYEQMERIGEGTYGVVYKGRNRTTNAIVAIKKIKLKKEEEGFPKTSIREISILKELQHANIVQLQDVVHGKRRLYLIFEHLVSDLKKHMQSYPNFAQDLRAIKIFLHQMLSGIACCHSRRIIHRDLKPQNLLIDCHTNTLKLADFGLARAFDISVKTFSHDVVTLWYRAPEILLGSPYYSTPVDVWSIGCIFAEMVNQKPLFPGKSEIDQLLKIFSILGTPNEDNWEGVTSLPDFKPIFPKWTEKDMKTLFPTLEPAGIDLIRKMLLFDPTKRISAAKALEHKYFEDISKRRRTQIDSKEENLKCLIGKKSEKIDSKCRIWSEEDEIILLKGAFSLEGHIDKSFCEFLQNHVSFNVTLSQIQDKLYRLKRRYKNRIKMKNQKRYISEHDQELFKLSKKLWEKSESLIEEVKDSARDKKELEELQIWINNFSTEEKWILREAFKISDNQKIISKKLMTRELEKRKISERRNRLLRRSLEVILKKNELD